LHITRPDVVALILGRTRYRIGADAHSRLTRVRLRAGVLVVARRPIGLGGIGALARLGITHPDVVTLVEGSAEHLVGIDAAERVGTEATRLAAVRGARVPVVALRSGVARRRQPLREDPVAAPVLTVAVPGNDELPRTVGADGRPRLRPGGKGVDLEFSALRRATGAVAAREHVHSAGGRLGGSVPRDQEAPVGKASQGRIELVARGLRVRLKLIAHALPSIVEALAEHTEAGTRTLLIEAFPRDHEAAATVTAHGGIRLRGLGMRVRQELASDTGSGAVVATADDAGAGAVRPFGLPHGHEAPRGVAAQRRRTLGGCRRRGHLKLTAAR
jgi:hypothetical protein